jgi:type IV pilus assembly protein PilA
MRKQLVITLAILGLAAFVWLGWQAEMKRRMYVQAAFITQAIGVMNSAKVHVLSAHDDKGEWPSSNEEAGIPPPSEFANGAISELRVSEGGVITVMFNAKSGVRNGTLRLRPHTGMDIQWKCTTPSFRNIERWAPQCTYEP